MAGHPTIGTAFVLALENLVEATGPETTIRLEEAVGVIPVQIHFDKGRPTLIKMRQPLPQFGPEFTARAVMADMLSLEVEGIDPDQPLQVVSCGVPFLLVPLKDLDTMRRAKLRLDMWERYLQNFASPHLFLFTQETELEKSSVHCRMFAPALGIAEDPATGAASGPLGCYLVKYGLVASGPLISLISEQGFEMGRPSFIYIEIEQTEGQISGVTVGGQGVAMGEGFIELPF
jgi:trans-2,3-dihydro-3-hydroxyanthranilate isomerase